MIKSNYSVHLGTSHLELNGFWNRLTISVLKGELELYLNQTLVTTVSTDIKGRAKQMIFFDSFIGENFNISQSNMVWQLVLH